MLIRVMRQEQGVYPLNPHKAKIIKDFNSLKKALNYWKKEGLNRKKSGYFLAVVEEGVAPITLRLEQTHFNQVGE